MKRIGILIGAILVLAAGAAGAAERAAPARGGQTESAEAPPAPQSSSAPAPPPAAGRAQTLSMEAVIAIIRKRTPGQQTNVVLDGADYKVRWKATNGRLIDYTVDAVSGAIRSADGE